MRLYTNATALIDGELVLTDILTDKGKITKIGKKIKCPQGAEVLDYTGKYILPALIDIHTHGADGYDFNLASLEQMLKVIDFYRKHGVGSVLPTVMTDTDETMCNQLATVAQLAKLCPEVKGIHLEGPFLAPDYKGAMPLELLQLPSVEKFKMYQKAANGLIKVVTISPELKGAQQFAKEVSAMGVVVSLGHSGAEYEEANACVKAGAKSFTHTFNAMKLPHQHHANIGGCAMLSDNYCELICDGRHVCPDMVRFMLKMKGIERIVLVTDSMMAAGLPDGQYKLGVNNVTVKEGDALITETGVRAGSTLTADNAFANFVQFTDLPVNVAIKAMTENPAKLLGIYDRCGSIAEGKDADFLVLDASHLGK